MGRIGRERGFTPSTAPRRRRQKNIDCQLHFSSRPSLPCRRLQAGISGTSQAAYACVKILRSCMLQNATASKGCGVRRWGSSQISAIPFARKGVSAWADSRLGEQTSAAQQICLFSQAERGGEMCCASGASCWTEVGPWIGFESRPSPRATRAERESAG